MPAPREPAIALRQSSRPLTQLVGAHIQLAPHLSDRDALCSPLVHELHGLPLELVGEGPAFTPQRFVPFLPRFHRTPPPAIWG